MHIATNECPVTLQGKTLLELRLCILSEPELLRRVHAVCVDISLHLRWLDVVLRSDHLRGVDLQPLALFQSLFDVLAELSLNRHVLFLDLLLPAFLLARERLLVADSALGQVVVI